MGGDGDDKKKGGDKDTKQKSDRAREEKQQDNLHTKGTHGDGGELSDDQMSDRSGTTFPYNPKTPIMSIGFHHKQYVSVSNAEEDTIDEVINAIKYNYSKGVKRRSFQAQEGMRRIELYGMPFQPYFMDHFTFVNAVIAMLRDLLRLGYYVISVANLGQGRDMFVWFFKREKLNTRGAHHFGLLEILGRCKLRCYGNIQDHSDAFEEIIKEAGHDIIDKESKFNLFTSLRINNNIWDTKRSKDTMKSKQILCKIMQKLENEGNHIYMAIPLDRKRSSIMYWQKQEKDTGPRKPGFFLTMMRKNRFVLTEADDKTVSTVRKALKDSWNKRVMSEDPLLSDVIGSHTFILEGNPFNEGPIQKVREILDTMFALLTKLNFEGWTPVVNIHMITNVIDRSSIWFEHGDVKVTEYCSISVENLSNIRAYKVPEKCIEAINISVLDTVLPESHDWTVKDMEYLWKFEEKVWVPSSSQEWNDNDTLVEKGHLILGTIMHTMMQEDFYPVIALNMPPSGVAETVPEDKDNKEGDEKKESGKVNKNLCTFFFAKNVPHYNSSVYPLKNSEDMTNSADMSDA